MWRESIRFENAAPRGGVWWGGELVVAGDRELVLSDRRLVLPSSASDLCRFGAEHIAVRCADGMVRLVDPSGVVASTPSINAYGHMLSSRGGTALFWCQIDLDRGWCVYRWVPGQAPRRILEGVSSFEGAGHLAVGAEAMMWAFFEWDVFGFDGDTGELVERHRGDRSECIGASVVIDRDVLGFVAQLNRDDEPIRPSIVRWRPRENDARLRLSGADEMGQVLAASHQGWIIVSDRARWTCRATDDGRILGGGHLGDRIAWLDLSPDDRRLAIGGETGVVVIYDV